MVNESHLIEGNSGNKSRFVQFQLTALLATCVDFAMTTVFKEVFTFHVALAVACGATCGAITAFTINRFWVFHSLEKNPLEQVFRYFLVAGGSVILNTFGTFLLTELTTIHYLISKAIVSIIIGFTYSYYFSKRFVFYA